MMISKMFDYSVGFYHKQIDNIPISVILGRHGGGIVGSKSGGSCGAWFEGPGARPGPF